MKKSIKFAFAASAFALLAACGGGGGGAAAVGVSDTGAKTNPQLAANVMDLSLYKNTFADTTLINGQLVTAGFSFDSLLKRFKIRDFFPTAFAQNLTSCNDNIKPVTINNSNAKNEYKKIELTSKEDDKPCFISSQEVGVFIAAQAKNLYQGEKKCDIVLMPKSGGKLHCLEAGIPASITEGSGAPEFKFSQAFAGIASLKSLGGKITDNGKYFFIAFSDDGTKTKGYDGVYRIDLSGVEPVGQLAYISEGVNPRSVFFNGYQQLENGDMIVSHMVAVSNTSMRNLTYYVGVKSIFAGLNSQQIVLINSAVQYQYGGDESPIFKWAKNNLAIGGEPITDGSSQNIVFSGSQDPNAKIFYYVIKVNRYQNFTGEYFNSLLIKGVVSGNQIQFEDYGPTSISFFGTAGVKEDLSKIYWIKDWTQGQISVVTRDLSKQVSSTDRTFMPENELSFNVNIPSDYKPTLLYTTKNKIFVSAVKSDFYDTNGLMNLKLYAMDKLSNGVYWTDRPNDLNEIGLTEYTGNNFRLQSAIPSLVSDKLTLRIERVSDGGKFSLDANATNIAAVDLGTRGAISNKHAVVSGK